MLSTTGDPKEIRTPVAGVRGRYPRPLDDEAILSWWHLWDSNSRSPSLRAASYHLPKCHISITSFSSTASPPQVIAEILSTEVVLYPNLVGLGRQGRKKSGLFQHYPPYYLRTLLPNASWFTLAQDSGRGPSSVYLSLTGFYLNLPVSTHLHASSCAWASSY